MGLALASPGPRARLLQHMLQHCHLLQRPQPAKRHLFAAPAISAAPAAPAAVTDGEALEGPSAPRRRWTSQTLEALGVA